MRLSLNLQDRFHFLDLQACFLDLQACFLDLQGNPPKTMHLQKPPHPPPYRDRLSTFLMKKSLFFWFLLMIFVKIQQKSSTEGLPPPFDSILSTFLSQTPSPTPPLGGFWGLPFTQDKRSNIAPYTSQRYACIVAESKLIKSATRRCHLFATTQIAMTLHTFGLPYRTRS